MTKEKKEGNSQARIKPTVGRIIHLFNHCNTTHQPRAAIVTHVNENDTVNLSVFDEDGRTYGLVGVPVVQEGESHPKHKAHARWMPYQIGQAKAGAAEEVAVSTGPVTLGKAELAKLDIAKDDTTKA